MSEQPAGKRKVDLGDPIQWTDEDLDNMSEIAQQDIDAAAALWRAGAPAATKKLLDAETKGTNGEETKPANA